MLYLFLQRFVFRGQMAAFGTVCNPAGCAVAYRREYLEALFDAVEPQLGDDLTNSEDIFIGLAMLNEGYRNVQVLDVCARTVEPEVQRLPKQIYLVVVGVSAVRVLFRRAPEESLQGAEAAGGAPAVRGTDRTAASQPAVAPAGSVAYAGMSGRRIRRALLSVARTSGTRSRVPGRPRQRRWHAAVGSPPVNAAGSRSRIARRSDSEHTRTYGRPVGWALLSSAVEKIGFPTVLLVMVVLGNWEGLLITVCAETLITVTALVVVMKASGSSSSSRDWRSRRFDTRCWLPSSSRSRGSHRTCG